eukprot:2761010-Pleurochrysis_carterae.AAC.1
MVDEIRRTAEEHKKLCAAMQWLHPCQMHAFQTRKMGDECPGVSYVEREKQARSTYKIEELIYCMLSFHLRRGLYNASKSFMP